MIDLVGGYRRLVTKQLACTEPAEEWTGLKLGESGDAQISTT